MYKKLFLSSITPYHHKPVTPQPIYLILVKAPPYTGTMILYRLCLFTNPAYLVPDIARQINTSCVHSYNSFTLFLTTLLLLDLDHTLPIFLHPYVIRRFSLSSYVQSINYTFYFSPVHCYCPLLSSVLGDCPSVLWTQPRPTFPYVYTTLKPRRRCLSVPS